MGVRFAPIVWLAFVLGACSSPQYVRFEAPRGAEVHVLRSLAEEGSNEGRVPGTWSIKAGRVYACRIRFDRQSLRDLGFRDAQIDILEREDHMTLEGGLVAFRGGDREQTLLLGLDADTVRAALLYDQVAVACGTDVRGETRVLLKVSVEGVPLDDPELATHGGAVKGALVVLGNVCIVAGKVVLYTAYVAAEILLRAPVY